MPSARSRHDEIGLLPTGSPDPVLLLAALLEAPFTALVQVFDAWMRDALTKLARKVEDLEDVKFLMAVLQKVRWAYFELVAAFH